MLASGKNLCDTHAADLSHTFRHATVNLQGRAEVSGASNCERHGCCR